MFRTHSNAYFPILFSAFGLLVFASESAGITLFEDFKIVKDEPACCGSQFGSGVSLQSDTAIVGSSYENIGSTIAAGAAFVYQKSGVDTWQEAARLTDPNPGGSDTFGSSVSLHGNLALIGAQFDGRSDTGAAFVFQKNAAGNWSPVATLMGNEITPGARFGNSVSLWGSKAIVGAIDDDATGMDSGAAYLFETDEFGNWVQKAKLTGDDTVGHDQFGFSVSLFANYALVGAASHGSGGAACLFQDDGSGNWQQIAKFVPYDLTADDAFGHGVAIINNRAVVGAPFADNNNDSTTFPKGHGSVYVFEPDSSGSWLQVAKLTANDLTELSHFGFSVSLSGNSALIGSLGDFNGMQDGAAYLFQISTTGSWSQIAKLVAKDGAPDNLFFGRSVSLSGSRALVGANRAAYLYHNVPEPGMMSLSVFVAVNALQMIRRRRA